METKTMWQKWQNGMRKGAAVFVVGTAAVVACDPFSVEDPARFTDSALDSALQAVANGVEGQFHLSMDDYITADALLSDVFRHTGTWTDYEDGYLGRYRYGNSAGNGKPDGVFNNWLRARYASLDAQKRFIRMGVADNDPKMVQVRAVEAWINLYLGESWCEAPADSGGPAVADAQLLQLAITNLTDARNLAQAAGLTRWVDYTTAGLARANLLAENYAAAATEAGKLPTTFQENAKFSSNSAPQYNSMVNLNTVGFNKAAGMRNKWWNQVDTLASKLIDPWSGQLDSRVEIRHPPKTGSESGLGVDGTTPFYSQWKYKAWTDDIPITHGREMRLIEAEVFWRNSQLDSAMARMNALRARTGVALPALPATADPNVVRDYLLSERFAELFMEGHRMSDLYRFNLVAATAGLGAGRLMRFPLSQFEAIWNENIDDVSSQRCQPIS